MVSYYLYAQRAHKDPANFTEKNLAAICSCK